MLDAFSAVATLKVNLPVIVCWSVASAFHSTVYVPDPSSSRSICNFLFPSTTVALFLSTRLPLWSVTIIVLIVGSRSSLNQSSSIFGACFSVAFAAGCDRMSRACPKADEWNMSTVTKIVQAMTLRLHSHLLGDESIFFHLRNVVASLVKMPFAPYGLVGGFSPLEVVVPCIPCIFISILPGRMRKNSFQETGLEP